MLRTYAYQPSYLSAAKFAIVKVDSPIKPAQRSY